VTAQAPVNWFDVLAHHAVHAPERPITVFEGSTTTYAQMADRAVALAGGLHERGVGPGDVVGLLSYNCPEFLQTMFAANFLGAIAMPINWRLAAPEVHYILEHSGAHALVCAQALVDLGSRGSTGLESLVRACVSEVPEGAGDAAGAGWTSLAELESTSRDAPRATTGPDDVHRLMYTSGTTGRPKGVMLTHANLAWKNLAHLV